MFDFSLIGLEGSARSKPTLEELERELQEEKIKEEIIARRIAQRRMVEEQMRREMEIDREMMMTNRFHHLPIIEPLMVVGPQERFGPVLLRREVELAERLPIPIQKEVELRERLSHPVQREDELRQRSPRSVQSEVELRKRLVFRASPSEQLPTSHEETKAINEKLTGIKRKAPASISGISALKSPYPGPKKDWSCALCQVTMTSEVILNDHLKGKKHLAMASKLNSNKKPVGLTTSHTGPSTTPAQSSSPMKSPRLVGKKVSILANGKMQEVIEKGSYLWCIVCGVKCNSRKVVEAHFLGKNHLLMELKKQETVEVVESAEEEEEEEGGDVMGGRG